MFSVETALDLCGACTGAQYGLHVCPPIVVVNGSKLGYKLVLCEQPSLQLIWVILSPFTLTTVCQAWVPEANM